MTAAAIAPDADAPGFVSSGFAASDAYEGDSAWSAWNRAVDHWTIGACLALFGIGVVLAFAASPALAARNDLAPFHYAWRHMIFGVPAFAAMLVLSFASPKGVRRLGAIIAVSGLIAVALLPLYGVSFNKGAVRWFSFGGLSVQPSEFLKPGLIVMCAWMLSAMAHRDPAVARAGALTSFLLAAGAIGLLIGQPDYGQAALIAVVWGAMAFLAGVSPFLLIGLAAAAFGVGAIAYSTEPHVAKRIDMFLDPGGAVGRQLQIAEEAIKSGGWSGVGLGDGVAKDALPDAHADFILPVAAEEYGFLLACAIVLLFAVITLRALWRLRLAEDAFAQLAGAGLALLIGLQAFVNVAVSVQLLPAKGMTLPFISYGGSSMLAVGVTMGLLLALTRRRPRDVAPYFGG